jgi:uncharacterized membrane protein (UPF0182 family)
MFRGARRRWLLVAVGVVVILLLLLSGLSNFYVDILWFREVQFSSVFWSVFWSKVVLGLIFGSLFFVLLLANLLVVRRLTPRFRIPTPEQEMIDRYRQAVEPYARYIIPGAAALVSLFVGLAAAAQWQTFLLWRSAGSVSFGRLDPVFDRDPAFYIFVLPFQKFVQGWLFSALVGILVIVAIAHYLWGNIRTQGPGERVTPAVRAHLSVLLGLIVLVKAWGYYLGTFDLLLSTRGTVTGASYTDIHAQLPALRLLAVIALVCAALFFVNIRYRIWALPAIGLGLLVLVSVVAGAIVPAAVQRFQVAPQELQREGPYIERDIAATRFAWGIDVEPTVVAPSSDITPNELKANDTTIENIRLWNPRILGETYQSLQRIQPYYEFTDVDVDRYLIGGQERMVMLSPREVDQTGIPGNAGWQQEHLIYTHGYGVAASRVNTAVGGGAPEFILRDIPVRGSDISLDPGVGSRVYYGELARLPYIVTNSNQPELDYPDPSGGGTVTTEYDGTGGIEVGSFFRRLVFAYRYRDFNLLISNLIQGDSKIMINRDIETRVKKAAPFLKYDFDPYGVIVDGRLFFVWDGYTTTDLYPYSQQEDLSAVTNQDLSGRANYIRNSVKVVVDAYNGSLTFYVVDEQDPLIKVWEQAFPDLFVPGTEAPLELQQHFRYPEDLLQAQSWLYSRYHVTDPATFFTNSERWEVPEALPTCPEPEKCPPTGQSLRPYYVLLKLPGDEREQFVLFQPFTPARRANMVGYFAAGSDPGAYGELNAFEFPAGEIVEGPQLVRNEVSQDPVVSPQISLLGQRGSSVQFGDLIIVPVEDGFLYVQPVVVRANAPNAIPELKRVVVVHGETVTIADTLAEALDASFGRPTEPTPPGEEEPPTAEVADLLAQALQHFQEAERLLEAGDLAGYEREIDAGQELVRQAEEAASTGASPTPSPSPTASPTG